MPDESFPSGISPAGSDACNNSYEKYHLAAVTVNIFRCAGAEDKHDYGQEHESELDVGLVDLGNGEDEAVE